ncbi:hypothetical protein DYB25_012525 [Aphanomyces astaci]|uniref:Fatty acid hydroxylase domain-containing protein n=1 Tax=Aphanomyces astaci TaxID=112090 RepID=A0A397EKF4_APHAT|nr:hypothetical protein DYB36_009181 [Aphanomyces astaci]RHY26132.1 hypothetical protein DYB25_012525 [Aphanomyces astaci]RHY94071.1 hypothetical protein DYB31_010804 [Aphanomyces astaci]RHZ30559.1 hypothetical protein DYB26_009198 [Aphanomyces astaci]
MVGRDDDIQSGFNCQLDLLCSHRATMEQLHAVLHSYNTLSTLEPTWAAWTADLSPFDLAFTYTAVVSSAALFGGSFVYFILDYQPSLRKYKLQPTRLPTLGLYWKCLKLSVLNQVVLHGAVLAGLLYLWGHLATFSASAPLPVPTTILYELVLFVLVEDATFYWVHRALHWKKVYKYVHKGTHTIARVSCRVLISVGYLVHHEFTAPFGLTAVYTHPVEELATILATLAGPLIFGSHILCLWVWLVLRTIETIDSHSGYDFPFTLGHFFPLLSGPARHDYHHEKFDCNYGSTLAFWDWFCGTDKAFRALQYEKASKGERAWFDVFDYCTQIMAKTKDI